MKSITSVQNVERDFASAAVYPIILKLMMEFETLSVPNVTGSL